MKKIILAAVALAVLGGSGFLVYQNLPMKRHARHIVKARLFVSEGNLTAARQEYVKAYDIMDGFTPWVSMEVLRLTNRMALQDKDLAAPLENTRKFAEANPDNSEGRLALAELAFQAQDPNLAFSSIEAVLAKEPGNFPARLLLARVRSQQGRLDLAEEQLRALYAAAPDSVDALVPLAENLLRQGQIDESRQFLGKVVAANPKNGMARLLLVDGYILERKPDSAGAILDAWSEADPALAAPIAVRKAGIRAQQGRFEEARAALQPHLEKREENIPAYSEWAMLEARQGRYDSAMAIYEKMGEIKPAVRGEALLMKAYLSLKARNPARALEALKSLAVGDRNGTLLPVQAAAYLAMGQDHKLEELSRTASDTVKQRLTAFTSQLVRDPEFIGQWALVTYFQANRQNYLAFLAVKDLHAKWPKSPLAIVMWSSQLAAGRSFAQAAQILETLPNLSLHQRIAILGLHMRSGKTDKAKAMAEKLLAENPGQRGLNLFLADYHFTRQEKDQAIAFYEKELAIDTGNLVALNNLAWEHGVTRKDLAKARPYLDRLRKNRAQDPRILDTVGWILATNGSAEGGDYLRTAVTLVPDHPAYNFHLAWSLAQAGKKEEAKKHLQTALTSKIPFGDRVEAEKLLSSL